MSPPRPAVALLLFLLLRHAVTSATAGTNISHHLHYNATIDTWTYNNQSRRIDIQKQPFSNTTASMRKYPHNFINTLKSKTQPTHYHRIIDEPINLSDATQQSMRDGNCTSNMNCTKDVQCFDTLKNKTNSSTSKENVKNISLSSKPIYAVSYINKRITKRNKSIQKPIEDSTLTLNQIVSKRNLASGADTSPRFMTNTNETSEKKLNARGLKQNVASRFIEFLPKTATMRLPDRGAGSLHSRAVVSLLGLFELSTRHGARPEGRSELAAARLAVKHINEKKLLPGYTLELLTNDTQVSANKSSSAN